MFFEKDILLFNILDVLELKQKNVNICNTGRNFDALSFRFHADTHLKTKHAEYHMKDNFVSYVPSRLDYSRSSKVDELIVVHFDALNYHTEDIAFFPAKDPHTLAELFRELLACWNKKDAGYRYKCSSILYEILADCYCQNAKPAGQNTRIKRSVDYLSRNYTYKDLSIREIANQSFMSEVYFRKLFKADFGISPQKYIINLRIQHAIGLIATGYYSLKEVADLSGYRDYKYFSVEFKKIVGVSPSEYSYNYKK